MPFWSYKSISDVANAFQITGEKREFIKPLDVPVSEGFRAELKFVLEEVYFNNSEFSVCENFIYPTLKEVWKSYTGVLQVWGHEPLNFDESLSGVPDYFVARRSPLGKMMRHVPPYVLLVVEAKRDNFEEGWGQCLAAMLAAQCLNQAPGLTVHGVVSNGRVWEFGKLQASLFTQDGRLFTLDDVEQLFGALHFIFTECQRQVLGQPCPA
jgi:hypothetical protein